MSRNVPVCAETWMWRGDKQDTCTPPNWYVLRVNQEVQHIVLVVPLCQVWSSGAHGRIHVLGAAVIARKSAVHGGLHHPAATQYTQYTAPNGQHQ